MLALSRTSFITRLAAYVALTKPRIIELLLVTTVPTMFVADRGVPSIWLMVATVIGGSLAAGGANAINMVIDRDIDRLMERTLHRPLVTGVVTPIAAMVFALSLEVGAFIWLALTVNILSAVLAISATAFYVIVYSMWLKRISARNIVIGGAAGAVPVLVGWSAVTGSLDWPPVILFLVIFYWTPPHFWALAIRYRNDYETAEIPMLPVVTSLETTARRILFYTAILVIVTIIFSPIAGMGAIYLTVSLVLGAIFIFLAMSIRFSPGERSAMRLFHYSITYVTLLFGSMIVDVLL